MVKNNLEIFELNEEKCTGCIQCELWCSFTYYNVFNPSKANIKIEDRYGLTPKITFLEGCSQCGQCAQHCLYGALKLKEVVD
jgi:formate hydrogenlyase subunit 6/NADH:ubiquinone oxidoreductase subunit I